LDYYYYSIAYGGGRLASDHAGIVYGEGGERREGESITDFSSSFHAEDLYAFDYCGAGIVDAVEPGLSGVSFGLRGGDGRVMNLQLNHCDFLFPPRGLLRW
jgi:hypothetical protein